MEKLTVETQVVKNYKLMDIPVMGNGAERLSQVEGWLVCNWEGEVTRYFKNCPHKDYFSPSDKGGLSVFGLDKTGQVIVGMCLYEGDHDSNDPIERGQHFYCLIRKSTNCWA